MVVVPLLAAVLATTPLALSPQQPPASVKEVRLLSLSDPYFDVLSESIQKRGGALTQVIPSVSGSVVGGSAGGGYTATSFMSVYIGTLQPLPMPVRGKYKSEAVKLFEGSEELNVELAFAEDGLTVNVKYGAKSLSARRAYVVSKDRIYIYRVDSNIVSSCRVHDPKWSDKLGGFFVDSSLVYDPASKTVKSGFGMYEYGKEWTEFKFTKTD